MAPTLLRRNLLVSGSNLSTLRGRPGVFGTALQRVTGPCAPCSRIETELGHGGWCERLPVPGVVQRAD
jgi:MOSC domain-containing protein YiiM